MSEAIGRGQKVFRACSQARDILQYLTKNVFQKFVENKNSKIPSRIQNSLLTNS